MKHTPVWKRLLKNLLAPLAALAVVVFFAAALEGLDQGQAEKGLDQLEAALRRGCVSCYAAEGVYPPSLDYLRTRYGVQIDETRYAVGYSVIGEKKLMPDITVTVLENDA